MKRGEIWFVDTGVGGDRPVLVLTRDPVADRIDSVVVGHVTATIRGVSSELRLGAADGLTRDCAVSFDIVHTVHRTAFRKRVAILSHERLREACTVMAAALGCGGAG